MVRQSPTPQVLWLQVGGLALVQGAITLMWVIYNFYLVDLLTQVGWPKSMAVGLLIVENALAIVMEPLMGSLSDQRRRWVGSQLPLIALGIILAAGLFLAIPFTVLGGAAGLRWLLPLLMVLWALAMTVFRSPILSLLGQYAMATRLPQANSLLTLVGGLAGSMQPVIGALLLGWGPMVAFAAGSAVLLGASLVLRYCQPNRAVQADGATGIPPLPLRLQPLALIFGAGVGIGLGFRCLMLVFPKVLLQFQPQLGSGLVLGIMFVTQAVTAIPAGALAVRVGNRRMMGLGLVAMALLTLAAGAVQPVSLGLGLAMALGLAFTPVLNGTIPFALSLVPARWFGLGTGLYFGGAALANCLMGAWLIQPQVGPGLQRGVGSLMFLLAAVCVGLSAQLQPIRERYK